MKIITNSYKVRKMPEIAVLGSTGSVGMQAMDVARQHHVSVRAVCAGRNWKVVEQQVREFRIPFCGMKDVDAARQLKIVLADTDVKVYSGSQGICQMIYDCGAETVVNAISGEAGLASTLATLEQGKKLALANKESLVTAGEVVMNLADEKGVEILPVDSEHCAIFQALRSGQQHEIKKLILTASGGPFFGYSKEELDRVTISDTMCHPTWNMGAKITVDSATLMNKGFEIIEAVHLFRVLPEQVEVVVHRESIIHSAVEYIDNSVIAQMAVPDMRLCIQNALTHPDRCTASVPELDLFSVGKFSFFPPDVSVFPLLEAAKSAIRRGGACPAVLNAANEIAVSAFLSGKITFTGIFDTVLKTFELLSSASNAHALDDILNYDRLARDTARGMIL